jgi:hypothetical protein
MCVCPGFDPGGQLEWRHPEPAASQRPLHGSEARLDSDNDDGSLIIAARRAGPAAASAGRVAGRLRARCDSDHDPSHGSGSDWQPEGHHVCHWR